MNKLKKYLKHKGVSQKKFAEIIGTTPNNLGLLVNGKSFPSLPLAAEIELNTGGLVSMYDWLPEKFNQLKRPDMLDDIKKIKLTRKDL